MNVVLLHTVDAAGPPADPVLDQIEGVLAAAPDFAEPGTVKEVLAAEAWARAQAQRMIATAAKGA